MWQDGRGVGKSFSHFLTESNWELKKNETSHLPRKIEDYLKNRHLTENEQKHTRLVGRIGTWMAPIPWVASQGYSIVMGDAP